MSDKNTLSTNVEEKGVSITTNLITGKREDGSELIKLNVDPIRAKMFEWSGDDPSKLKKIYDDEWKKTYNLPTDSTLILATRDGSKIYHIGDGWYLDLTEFLTINDFDINKVATIDQLNTYTSLDYFHKAMEQFVPLKVFEKKFNEYYDKYEIEGWRTEFNNILKKLPSEVYSKHEVNVLIDNIDTYTIAQLDAKFGNILDTIVTNNNDWYKSLKGLATVNELKNTLKDFVPLTKLTDVQNALDFSLRNITNRLDNNYFNKSEILEREKIFVEKEQLKKDIKDFITLKTLNDSITDFVTNQGLKTKLDVLVTKDELSVKTADMITPDLLDRALLGKVEKTYVDAIKEEILTEFSSLDNKLSEFISETDVDAKLENYVTKSSLNIEIANLRDVFNNYVTNDVLNSAITTLERSMLNKLDKKVNIEDYNTDKSRFASTTLLNSVKQELINSINGKVDTNYVDTNILNLKNELNREIVKKATDEDVDLKLSTINNTINSMYTNLQIDDRINNVKETLEEHLMDAENSFLTKSTFNNEIVKKADINYVNNKIDDLKNELDVDEKIKDLITEAEMNEKLNDFHTKTEIEGKLNTKVNATDISNLKQEITDETNLKINEVKSSISDVSSNISSSINGISTDIINLENRQIEKVNELRNIINDVRLYTDSLETKVDSRTKIDNLTTIVEGYNTNTNDKFDRKSDALNDAIKEVKKELEKKLESSDIQSELSVATDNINNTKLELENKINETKNEFSKYLLKESYDTEKTTFAKNTDIDNVNDTINSTKTELKQAIDVNKNNIVNLDNVKLNKTDFEELKDTIIPKSELLAKLITFEQVFRKEEVSEIVALLKTDIKNNLDKITLLDTELKDRITNDEISRRFKDIQSVISTNTNAIYTELGSRVEKGQYTSDINNVNVKLNEKVSYFELQSTIANNNKNYQTASEILNTINTLNNNLWTNVRDQYVSKLSLDNVLDNYTTLTKLAEELSKYTTLEKLEEKILEINGLTRSDVLTMISDNTTHVVNGYKAWINNLLENYVTITAFRDALNEKVSVNVYNTKMTELETTLVTKTQYDTDLANMVTTENAISMIDNRTLEKLKSYYNKEEVNSLIKSVQDLIVSNSSLFYTKDIVDSKLNDYHTLDNFKIEKINLTNTIDEIKNKFSDYPTTIAMEARLNAILGQQNNISTDSFYTAENTDFLLSKKVDVEEFEKHKLKTPTKDELSSELVKYLQISTYTSEINGIRQNITTIEARPILALNHEDIVLKPFLTNTLENYVKKSEFQTFFNNNITTSLTNYVDNDELREELNRFRTDLTDITNLSHYVNKTEFNILKNDVYNRSYIDEIKTNLSDNYSKTTVMDAKIDEVKRSIISEEKIREIAQTQGGIRYSNEEIDNKVSQKIDMVTLNNTLDLKDTEYSNKFIEKTSVEGIYLPLTQFENEKIDFLSKTNGGSVVGSTTFNSRATFSDGINTNALSLSNGDITNVRKLTVSDTLNSKDGLFTSLNSSNLDISNNMSAERLVVKRNLSIPVKSLDNDLSTNPFLDFPDVENNIKLFTKTDSDEIILNIGLPDNVSLSNGKMLKFNTDGSLSIRSYDNVNFNGNWSKLALISDLDTLSNNMSNIYVKNNTFNNVLENYYDKNNLDSKFNLYYKSNTIDEKINEIKSSLNRLDIKSWTIEELNKKAENTTVQELQTVFNEEKNNRYSKEEMNKVWKPQLMSEINKNLTDNWVSKVNLSTTLADYVSTAQLEPRLTQHGADIMQNISSNYVKLNDLTNKLTNYTLKTELESTVNTLVSESELAVILNNYTNTENMNLIHTGMNSQITLAVRTANTTKDSLDSFKDVVSTNYYNKADTAGAIQREVVRQIAHIPQEINDAKTEVIDLVESTKTELNDTIANNKRALDAKDVELLSKIEANTAKFNNYTLSSTFNQSITTERGISDDKYLSKNDAVVYAKKQYVDERDLLKANLAGSTFTGDISAPNITSTNNLITSKLITNTLDTGEISYKMCYISSSGQINMSQLEQKFRLGTVSTNDGFGVIVGNSTNNNSVPSGFMLTYNNVDVIVSPLTTENRDGGTYFKPVKNVEMATKEYVTGEISKLATGEMQQQMDAKIQQVNTTVNNIVNNALNTSNVNITTPQETDPSFAQWVMNQIIKGDKKVSENFKLYVTLTQYQNDIQTINNKMTEDKAEVLSTLRGETTNAIQNLKTQDLTQLEARINAKITEVDNKIGAISEVLNQINGE